MKSTALKSNTADRGCRTNQHHPDQTLFSHVLSRVPRTWSTRDPSSCSSAMLTRPGLHSIHIALLCTGLPTFGIAPYAHPFSIRCFPISLTSFSFIVLDAGSQLSRLRTKTDLCRLERRSVDGSGPTASHCSTNNLSEQLSAPLTGDRHLSTSGEFSPMALLQVLYVTRRRHPHIGLTNLESSCSTYH